MHVHIVTHEEYEGPGAIEDWCTLRDHHVTRSRVWLHESLPEKLDDLDFLIIMGGPQSVSTSKEECAHFDAMAEKNLICRRVQANKIVLGICLGAQLIGDALGAPPVVSPEEEYGWHDVELLDSAGQDILCTAGFPSRLSCFHWHSEMPGLTPNARILAASLGCPRQIVQYQDRVFGFQCHLESTKQTICKLLANLSDPRTDVSDESQASGADSLDSVNELAANSALWSVLDVLTAEVMETEALKPFAR